MRKSRIALLGACVVLAGTLAVFGAPRFGAAYRPATPDQFRAAALPRTGVRIDTVATGLEQPWALAFLPDGRMIVTEKAGRLRLAGPDGDLSAPVAGVPVVDSSGQGGLLDVAVMPGGPGVRLCLSFAEPRGRGTTGTSVACGLLNETGAPALRDVQVIWRQTPAWDSTGHYGSRLVPRDDGTLFITTGDRQQDAARPYAQRLDASLGKVVRVAGDGSIPADNPFVGRPGALPDIWSYGHRNIQSAALDDQGRLWTVEHGPRGGDELNRPEPGKNYGWPVISYGTEYHGPKIGDGITAKPGMEQPVYYWDPIIAPSGMAFYQGDAFPQWRGNILIGGLATEAVIRLMLANDRVVGEERIAIGARVRDVAIGKDGLVYLVTDEGDGRILRLRPRAVRP